MPDIVEPASPPPSELDGPTVTQPDAAVSDVATVSTLPPHVDAGMMTHPSWTMGDLTIVAADNVIIKCDKSRVMGLSSYLYLHIQNDTMLFENPDCEVSAVIAHLLDLLIQPTLYDFDFDVSTPWDLWALSLEFACRYDCSVAIRLLRSELVENLIHSNIANLRAFTRAAMLNEMTLAWHALINKNLHGTWSDAPHHGHNLLDTTVMPAQWREAIPSQFMTALNIAWYDARSSDGTWVNLGNKFIDVMRLLSNSPSVYEVDSNSNNAEVSNADGQGDSPDANGQDGSDTERLLGDEATARAQSEKADLQIRDITDKMDKLLAEFAGLDCTINTALLNSLRTALSPPQSPKFAPSPKLPKSASSPELPKSASSPELPKSPQPLRGILLSSPDHTTETTVRPAQRPGHPANASPRPANAKPRLGHTSPRRSNASSGRSSANPRPSDGAAPSTTSSNRPAHLPERPSEQTIRISQLPARPVLPGRSGHLPENEEKRKARLDRHWRSQDKRNKRKAARRASYVSGSSGSRSPRPATSQGTQSPLSSIYSRSQQPGHTRTHSSQSSLPPRPQQPGHARTHSSQSSTQVRTQQPHQARARPFSPLRTQQPGQPAQQPMYQNYPGYPATPGYNPYGYSGHGSPMAPQAVAAANNAVNQAAYLAFQSSPEFQDQGGYFSSFPTVYPEYSNRDWYAQTPTFHADPNVQTAPADLNHWTAGPWGMQAGQRRNPGGPRFNRTREGEKVEWT